jgi:hypothetical protein
MINGQKLSISQSNDIEFKDMRSKKNELPEFLKKDDILITIWEEPKIKPKINNKFDKKGFFMCEKSENKYDKIYFGKPFNYEYFIECIKNKKNTFDSGMYTGNNRNYYQFRGISSFWTELINQEY